LKTNPISLPVLDADQLQPDLTHHLPGLTPYDREREPVGLCAEGGLIALANQGLPHLRAVTGIPVEIPGHVWARLVGVKIIEIVGSERSQSEPGRLNRVFWAEQRNIGRW
jgi:hypothetical protein